MIVVADTSPINYLLQIGQEDILPKLYGQLVVPSTVLFELHAERAPDVVKAWATHIPSWVTIQQPKGGLFAALSHLDAGEAAALQLALEIGAGTVLMDEWAGTRVGRELGLVVTGTLGILRDAHELKLIDGRKVFGLLRNKTNFRLSRIIADAFLATLSE